MFEGTARFALEFAVGVLPVFALLALFRRFDRARPVPRGALYSTLVLGALACVGSAALEAFWHRVLGDAALLGARAVDAFFVVALTEESLKLLAVLAYTGRARSAAIVEVIDGVVFTVAAGLGLGLLENVALTTGDLATGLARASTAVPAHAVFSGVLGYFVGRARFVSSASRGPVLLAGLCASVALHGAYDWAVFNRGAWWFAQSSLVLVAGAALLAWLVRDARRLDEAMLGRPSLHPTLQTWPSNVTTTLVPTGPLEAPAAVRPEGDERAGEAS